MTYTSRLWRTVHKNQPPDFPLFGLCSFALISAQAAWAIRVDREYMKVLQAAWSEHRPFAVWDYGYGLSLIATAGLGLFGFIAVAFLFSDQRAIRPRWGWAAFAAWALVLTFANLECAQGPRGGYADLSGATWLDRHGVIEKRPWQAATGLVAGCSRSSKYPRLWITYDVRFGDRRASLGRNMAPEDVPKWLANVTAIDAKIPRDARFTRTAFSLQCISYFAQATDLAGDRALVGLFRPTADHAKRMADESPVWSQFVAQVAEERDARRRAR